MKNILFPSSTRTLSPEPIGDGAWAAMALLRFFLAMVVFSAHARLAASGGWLEFPVNFGAFAAILSFLFISGFSIAHSVSSEEKGFYLRRIARIMPVHIVTLLLLALPLMAVGVVQNSNGAAFGPPSNLKLFLNFFLLNGTIVGPINGASWSLACEVFFYCCASALLWLVARQRYLFLVLLAFSSAVYFFNQRLGIGVLPNTYHGLSTLSLFWAWGSGFYYYFHRNSFLARALILLQGSLLLARFNPEGGMAAAFTFSLTAFVLLFVDHITLKDPRLLRFFNYLGDLSFPLFMCHFPLVVLLNGIWGIQKSTILFLIVMGVTIAIYHGIDRPCRRYISKLHKFDRAAKRVALCYVAAYIILSFVPV